MSRDLKPKKSQPARKKARGGTLIGMFLGLVLGVIISAAVLWTMNKSPLPFTKQVYYPSNCLVASSHFLPFLFIPI